MLQVPLAQWEGVWKPLWLLAGLLNSAYSYFWDLERDWEVPAFTGRSGEGLTHITQNVVHGSERYGASSSQGIAFWGDVQQHMHRPALPVQHHM